MSDPLETTTRPWQRWAAVGAALLLLGALIGWAAAVVLTPARDVLDSTTHTYVIVEPGEVGASLSLNTVAEWTSEPVGANRALGVVTTVDVEAGDETVAGDVLYTVNMRPVVVAEGAIPAYRAIAQGARGEDVAQLQRLLISTGHYSGQANGIVGGSTADAIRRWQQSLGVERSGVVGLGDVIFVPHLPTRVALDETLIYRGALISGGESVVRALSTSPNFVIVVSDTQAGMMPLGARVEIRADGSMWEGFVAGHGRDQLSMNSYVALAGAGGAVLCGQECGKIPPTGQTLLPTRIITVESVSGLVVPSAALTIDASGRVAVIDEEGTVIPVTIVASARGMSVIEGVTAGMRVRVPADASVR